MSSSSGSKSPDASADSHASQDYTIEDDILITDGPAKVLSDFAPKTIAEIEKLMDRGQANAN